MKKLTLICLLLMSAQVFAIDMLDFVQGKWKVDVEATQKLPPSMPPPSDPGAAKRLEARTQLLPKMRFEFKKDSWSHNLFLGQTTEFKFTVAKNTADELVIENEDKEQITLIKNGKNIIFNEHKSPPIVLTKDQ